MHEPLSHFNGLEEAVPLPAATHPYKHAAGHELLDSFPASTLASRRFPELRSSGDSNENAYSLFGWSCMHPEC